MLILSLSTRLYFHRMYRFSFTRGKNKLLIESQLFSAAIFLFNMCHSLYFSSLSFRSRLPGYFNLLALVLSSSPPINQFSMVFYWETWNFWVSFFEVFFAFMNNYGMEFSQRMTFKLRIVKLVGGVFSGGVLALIFPCVFCIGVGHVLRFTCRWKWHELNKKLCLKFQIFLFFLIWEKLGRRTI